MRPRAAAAVFACRAAAAASCAAAVARILARIASALPHAPRLCRPPALPPSDAAPPRHSRQPRSRASEHRASCVAAQAQRSPRGCGGRGGRGGGGCGCGSRLLISVALGPLELSAVDHTQLVRCVCERLRRGRRDGMHMPLKHLKLLYIEWMATVARLLRGRGGNEGESFGDGGLDGVAAKRGKRRPPLVLVLSGGLARADERRRGEPPAWAHSWLARWTLGAAWREGWTTLGRSATGLVSGTCDTIADFAAASATGTTSASEVTSSSSVNGSATGMAASAP